MFHTIGIRLFVIDVSFLFLYAHKSNAANNYDLPLQTRDSQFRLKKYNEVWQEAQLILNTNDQLDLHNSLVELDKLSLIAKHEGVSGKKSKFNDLELDQRLAELLRKYNLNEIADSLETGLTRRTKISEKANFDPNEETLIGKHPALLKLWQDAQQSGFGEQELLNLKREFVHYAQKQDKHIQKLKYFHEAENSVLHETGFTEDAGKKESVTSDLKAEHEILNSELEKLGEKVTNEKVKIADGLFTNAKSRHLWTTALKSGNFTDQQLSDLQLELSHFDSKINKLNLAQTHLDEARFRWTKKGKQDYANKDEYQVMQQKIRDYERNVDKLEKYFQQKLEL